MTRCPTSSSRASSTLPGTPPHRARDAHRHGTSVSMPLWLVHCSSDVPNAMGRTARGELDWRKATTQQEKEAAVLRRWMQERLESLAHECMAPIPAEDRRTLDELSHLYHVVHSTLAAKIGRTNPAHGQLLTDLWRRCLRPPPVEIDPGQHNRLLGQVTSRRAFVVWIPRVADAHQTTSGNSQPGVRRAQHDAPAGEGDGGADRGAAQRRAGEQGERCCYVRTARTAGGGADADRDGAPLAASTPSRGPWGSSLRRG